MNSKKWIVLLVTLALIGGVAGMLDRVKNHQRLSPPAVKTHPLPDTANLEVELPEQALDYSSKKIDTQQIVLDTLPPDTSYGQRRYVAADGFAAQVNVVLMGTDRTSLHKPQFCLEGGGWKIDSTASSKDVIHMTRPEAYDLPVVKLISSREIIHEGKNYNVRGIYVYWFVADDAMSNDSMGLKRTGQMAWKLVRTGVLQRWAYISYFAACTPGQEDNTYARLKKLIAASVPEFQLIPAPGKQLAAAQSLQQQ